MTVTSGRWVGRVWSARAAVAVLTLSILTGPLVGALTGCAGLPESSAVQQGLEIGPPVVAPLQVRFEPPRAGATPIEILRGFLAAGVDLDEDAAAPRAFLTGSAFSRWDPLGEVVIHSGSVPVITMISASKLQLRGTVDAVIAPGGRYVEQPPGAVRTVDIGMEQLSDGEWRIAALPKAFGLWLSRSYADQTFAPFRMHYLSASSRILVPDVRWFPLVGGGLATTLARAQLEAVPAYLKGAAGTGFLAGTGLSVDAVPMEAGTAVVDLTSRLLDASSQRQRGAWAQLLATLYQIPGVDRVAVRVDGKPLALADTRSPVQSIGDLGYAGPGSVSGPQLLTRVGRKLTMSERATLRGATERLPPKHQEATRVLPSLGPEWVDVAAAPKVSEVAAVDSTRSVLQLWSTAFGSTIRTERLGQGLAPPAYDRYGVLWVAGRDQRNQPALWVLRPRALAGETLSRVDLKELNGAQIASIRVASDGQRVAIITRSVAGRTQLGISGITRDRAAVPLRLSAPVPVGGSLVEARDLTWIDDITLGVLGRAAADRVVRPYVVPLARPSVPLASVAGLARIVATGDGLRGLLVLTTGGAVLAPVGSRWQDVGLLLDVAVPGS